MTKWSFVHRSFDLLFVSSLELTMGTSKMLLKVSSFWRKIGLFLLRVCKGFIWHKGGETLLWLLPFGSSWGAVADVFTWKWQIFWIISLCYFLTKFKSFSDSIRILIEKVLSMTKFGLFAKHDGVWTFAEIIRTLEPVMSWDKVELRVESREYSMMSPDFKINSSPYTQRSSSHNRLSKNNL